MVVERGKLTPLADTARLLRDVHAKTDKILVGLSGGKDSIVVLDQCVREFGAKNTHAYFMYLVDGLRCAEMTIDYCERRLGVMVHRFPHWRLSLIYKNAMYMPHWNGADTGRRLKQLDIERAAREASGCDWIAYGHRLADSIERIAMLKSCGGFDTKGRRVYPLMRWNEASVYAYLRQRKFLLPPKLSILKRQMTGVGFHEDTLLAIRERFPDDYAKIMEVFPYVESKLARYEMKKKSWKQKTYVDTWRSSLKGR